MRQFISGTDSAFVDLQTKATAACIVFNDVEMPPGSTPPRGRVGFEVDPALNTATLFVDRGISYEGPNPEVREWLHAGEKHFLSFSRLQSWIVEGLGPSYPRDDPADS
jgi:hypothetical protein